MGSVVIDMVAPDRTSQRITGPFGPWLGNGLGPTRRLHSPCHYKTCALSACKHSSLAAPFVFTTFILPRCSLCDIDSTIVQAVTSFSHLNLPSVHRPTSSKQL